MNSSELHGLYNKIDRDVSIYELNDYVGLQVIREYPSSFKKLLGSKMFINFYLLEEDNKFFIQGSVDIVKENKEYGASSWSIETSKGLIIQKPTNYSFRKSENILFIQGVNRIFFKDKYFTVNEFIDILEKNHLKDMFLLSRFSNLIKIILLHILFFLVDSKYEKFKWIFKEGNLNPEEVKPASKNPDPLFHYFFIYKNILGLFMLLFIFFSFYLSVKISYDYFTVSNPFILIFALFLLYVLEKFSFWLHKIISSTDFVKNTSLSSLEVNSSLKL